LNNDVNVPSKRNKHIKLGEKKIIFCWHLEDPEQDPEPDPQPGPGPRLHLDPVFKGTDPMIRNPDNIFLYFT
jgi:hypothetical protein